MSLKTSLALLGFYLRLAQHKLPTSVKDESLMGGPPLSCPLLASQGSLRFPGRGLAAWDPGRCQGGSLQWPRSRPQGQKVGVLRQALPWLLPSLASLAREGRLPWAWLLRARPGSRLGPKQIPESPSFPPQHTQGWAPSPPSSGDPGFSPALAQDPELLPSCQLFPGTI